MSHIQTWQKSAIRNKKLFIRNRNDDNNNSNNDNRSSDGKCRFSKLQSLSICHILSPYLNVPRPLDVLAVISPRLGRAEALRSKLAVEHTGHLDAVGGLGRNSNSTNFSNWFLGKLDVSLTSKTCEQSGDR